MTATDKGSLRDRLEGRRIELLHRYRDLLDRADEELADHSPELIDTANEQWDARVLDAMSQADAIALDNVVAALKRVDAGTYGVCTACEEPIALARLLTLPEVAQCASCANEAEQRNPRWFVEVE